MAENVWRARALRIWRKGLPVWVLLFALGTVFLLFATRGSTSRAPAEERVWHVASWEAERVDIRPDLRVFGEIAAGREVDLRAPVAGEIVEIWPSLREGGVVRSGENLLRIDPFVYETAAGQARAGLLEARARLREYEARHEDARARAVRAEEQAALRRRDLERADKLVEQGHISEKTLDDKRLVLSQQTQASESARSSLAIEAARVEQQKAVVERMEIALTRAERDLSETLLTAPVSGYLSGVSAGLGRRLNTNDRIARLIDSDNLEARWTLSDSQFGRVFGGVGGEAFLSRPVEIVWRVGEKALRYGARIARTGARISAARGGTEVYATLDPLPPDTPLRPGAFVEISLPDRLYEGVFRFPEEVLHREGEGLRVYAIVEGRLEPRRVEEEGRFEGDVLLSGEVKTGDRILTTRFAEASPGLKVLTVERSDR